MLTTLVLAFTLGVTVADVGYQYKAPINPFGASSYPFNKYNSGFSSTTSYPAVSFGKAVSSSNGLLKPGVAAPSTTTFALSSSGSSGNFAQGLSGSSGNFAQGLSGSSGNLAQGLSGSAGNFAQGLSGSSGNFAQGLSGTSGNFAQGISGSTGYAQQGLSAPTTTFGQSSAGSSFKPGLSNTGALEQGSIASAGTFSQGSYKTPTSFGQGTNAISGSFGQGSSTSSSTIGPEQTVTSGYNNYGYSPSGLSSKFGVSSGSGASQKVITPTSFNTKYTLPRPNYNTFGNSAATLSGSSVTGSGVNSKLSPIGSPGLSASSYPTHGGGSGSYHHIPNQQGLYQGSFTQNTGYEGTYQTTVDTSALDNIGNYYQSASAANQFISSNQYQNVVQNYHDYQVQRQPAQVFKHYYVHAIPEDKEIPKPLPPIVLPPPQKHYKVIFIKAPTQQPTVPQFIPVPQQNEEKTIVYVLVKKPEDAKNIVLPKFEEKAPTKPDVFFIKYNDKQDSQALIDNIVNDYNKGGVSATFSGISNGLSGSTISGFKTSSSLPSTSVINKSNKISSGSTSDSFESIFGKNQNAVSSFGSQIGDISTVTPSSVAFSSSTTFAPSTFGPVFQERFGPSSESAVSSGTGSPFSTASYSVKPISNLSSANTFSTTNSVTSKPSVSFGSSVAGSSFGSKPSTSFAPSSSFGSSYTSGSASSLGSTSNIKPSVTIGADTPLSYGYGTTESNSPSNVNSISSGRFSTGNSFVTDTTISHKPSVNTDLHTSFNGAGSKSVVSSTTVNPNFGSHYGSKFGSIDGLAATLAG